MAVPSMPGAGIGGPTRLARAPNFRSVTQFYPATLSPIDGLSATERRFGLGASEVTPAGVRRSRAVPVPVPLPPVVFPGTPENDRIVDSLNDIWNGLTGGLKPPPSGRAQDRNRYEEECEEQNRRDLINCQIVGAIHGRQAARICQSTA